MLPHVGRSLWTAIAPLLPGKATDCGVTAKDNRLFINALAWLMRTGVPWADLPARFGKPHSVGQRFRRLAKVFAALQEPALDWVLLDSTLVRAHQHAAGQKKVTPPPSVLAAAAAV